MAEIQTATSIMGTFAGFRMTFENGWTLSFSGQDKNWWAWDKDDNDDTPEPRWLSDNEAAAYIAEIAGRP